MTFPGLPFLPEPETDAERRWAAGHYYDLGRRLEQAGSFADQQWCRHHQAEDAAGQQTTANDPRAVRYCAVGLAIKEARSEAQGLAMILALRAALGGWAQSRPDWNDSLPDWNDAAERQPEEVRELFRIASRQCYAEALAQQEPEPEPEREPAASRG